MTLTILGVDPSLAATGLAKLTIDNTTVLGDGLSDPAFQNLVQVQTVTVHSSGSTKDKPRQRRLRVQSIRRQILRAAHDADLVLIETPYHDRNQQQAALIDRSWLWGSVLDGLAAADTPVAHVAIAKVKHIATGKGGGAGTDKTAVAAGMVRMWGDRINPHGDNEFDALALATIGGIKMARHRLPIRVLDRHLELVAGIDWTELEQHRADREWMNS
ncbi:RuvC-like resolvase [Gordonia phage Verity]|uniref:RuvC-like resolvase n=1 Tax=Gordonia phage Verity TaxID=2591211 RepID=A0A514DIV5_9CAUD|nr:RuvC-like resolvase [Gordonia phage Verity]QDH93551.1 RuvC-like resolvase [Gordonia phage Verity]QPO16908.1 RuvC-like resolvase [Gordonia phage Delrey21]QXN74191.1 RuvC-like resolvase [Gordonia phage DoctorFroggo]